MRAIIYTRVSTDAQEENYSLPSQLVACRRYAEQHGMTVVAELSDVMSGAMLDRPSLTQVRDLLRAGAAEALIVFSSDRLSRAVAHMLLLRDELRAQRATLHVVSKGQASVDTPEGNLFDTIESAFAEYERLKIKERTQRGRRQKAESGKMAGNCSPPYGYRYSDERRDSLSWNDDEADVMRQIGRWFLDDDMGLSHIRQRLTAMRVPTPGDTRHTPRARQREVGHWNLSTIYKLLRNPVYVGAYYALVDRRYKKTHATDRVVIAVPPIFDTATWNAIQAKLDAGKKHAVRNTKRFYLLRSRIRCACGYSAVAMTPANRPSYYRCCAAQGDVLHKCHAPYFRAAEVDHAVWSWLDHDVLDEDHIRAAVAAQQHSADDTRARLDAERGQYYKQLADLEQQAARLAQLFVAGLYTFEQVEQHKKAIDRAEASTRAELEKVEARLAAIDLVDTRADELCASVRACRARIDAGLSNETKRKIVDIADVTVVLRVIEGKKYADATCHLTCDHRVVPIVSTSS